MTTKAIGLDYHGVVTANPRMFSVITKILRNLDYEVHIITGSRITDQLKEQLSRYDIPYTHWKKIVWLLSWFYFSSRRPIGNC